MIENLTNLFSAIRTCRRLRKCLIRPQPFCGFFYPPDNPLYVEYERAVNVIRKRWWLYRLISRFI